MVNSTMMVTLSAVKHDKTYDVIVVGGGTAGAIAAIAAAFTSGWQVSPR